MPDDERLTWGFVHEVRYVMERHDYCRSDRHRTSQAIGLIRDTARIYEGTLDAPRGRLRRRALISADRSRAARPTRRHRLGRTGQDPAGRFGRSRRMQARPGRLVRRPVLHLPPSAAPDRRCLRRDGLPDELRRRGLRRPAAPPTTRHPPAAGRRRSSTRMPDSVLAPDSPSSVPASQTRRVTA